MSFTINFIFKKHLIIVLKFDNSKQSIIFHIWIIIIIDFTNNKCNLFITFGNLNDESSEVTKRQEEHRAYATLAELNIRPRAVYLARLNNSADGGDASSDHDAPHHEDDSHGKESSGS